MTVVFVGHLLYDLDIDQRYGCGVLLTRLIEIIGALEWLKIEMAASVSTCCI